MVLLFFFFALHVQLLFHHIVAVTCVLYMCVCLLATVSLFLAAHKEIALCREAQ